MRIDERLRGPLRSPRTRPSSLLVGPTGRRLWADLLDDVPGFRGSIDYVHKLNIPLLFTVGTGAESGPQRSEGEWLPSHLRTQTRLGAATVTETRFITWTDEAVSVQRWTNGGDVPITVRGAFDTDWCERDEGGVHGERLIDAHGFTLTLAMRAHPQALWDGIVVEPGATLDVTVVAAVRHRSTDDTDPLIDPATDWSPTDTDLVDRQRRDYQTWFDDVPDLRSDLPILDRAWAYRWYILRSTVAEPQLGSLRGPVMYEGRSHKAVKDDWRPTGWEFSKLIPLSSPFHIVDLRWRGDTALAAAVMDSVAAVQGDDGQLYASTVRNRIKPYASWYGYAVAEFARVHGRRSVSDLAVATARRQVIGERVALEAGADELPIQRDHKLTGKEYQPSYWAFHDFPDDPVDPRSITPLKRVDRAIYQHLNARGVAELDRAAGQCDEAIESIRDVTAASVIARMWDERTAFFVDLRAADDEPARVRNVVGFYPWWAGIADARHAGGLRSAIGAGAFGTTLPYPSTAADEVAFRPQGGWMGRFLKGRNGCMWNGPSWPYTTGIVLDALAAAASDAGDADGALAAEFARGMRAYLRSHFRDGDLAVPYLVEHYDPLTGEPLSDEPDYSHSSLIDLIVRRVVGLIPTGDGWTLRPMEVGAGAIDVRELPVGEHRVTVDSSPLRAAAETTEAPTRRLRVTCVCGVLFDGVVDANGAVFTPPDRCVAAVDGTAHRMRDSSDTGARNRIPAD